MTTASTRRALPCMEEIARELQRRRVGRRARRQPVGRRAPLHLRPRTRAGRTPLARFRRAARLARRLRRRGHDACARRPPGGPRALRRQQRPESRRHRQLLGHGRRREGRALQGALGIALSQGIDYVEGASRSSGPCPATMPCASSRPSAPRQRGHRGSTSTSRIARRTEVSGVRAVPSSASRAPRCATTPATTPAEFFVAIPEQPAPVERHKDMFELVHRTRLQSPPCCCNRAT